MRDRFLKGRLEGAAVFQGCAFGFGRRFGDRAGALAEAGRKLSQSLGAGALLGGELGCQRRKMPGGVFQAVGRGFRFFQDALPFATSCPLLPAPRYGL